jgi:large subunit ribosomal protein L15
MKLNELTNSHRAFQKRKRCGRGVGSKLGKTCGRGHKGAGSRAGWKSRARYEGGQIPLYRKLPERGFTRGRFARPLDSINLADIENLFENGEVVNLRTLRDKNVLKGISYGLKILGHGDITKKVTIEANAISDTAKSKLESAGISFTIFA